ncbi:metabotropic glutamate receptor, partial [Biomphalaria glabrata]
QGDEVQILRARVPDLCVQQQVRHAAVYGVHPGGTLLLVLQGLLGLRVQASGVK